MPWTIAQILSPGLNSVTSSPVRRITSLSSEQADLIVHESPSAISRVSSQIPRDLTVHNAIDVTLPDELPEIPIRT